MLYLSHAAVDEQLDTGYEAAVIEGQAQDGLSNFVHGARTAEGYVANRVLHILINLLFGHPKRGVVARCVSSSL